MSGGFIPPPTTQPDTDIGVGRDEKPEIGPEPLLRLTSRQEGRLRHHLDGRLSDLERDSKTHGFGSLEALLGRLRPILRLILQIPPVESWSSLRISYLLAFTGSMINYITSLPLLPTKDMDSYQVDNTAQGHVAGQEEQAGQVMRDTIDFLHEVDRAWRTVLKGNAWVMGPEPGSIGRAVRVSYAGTVGQTERIRLRSIVMTGRAKVLAWARSYGSFPGAALGVNGAQTPTRTDGGMQMGDWETEIMGLWNGILDSLSKSEGEREEEADEMDPEEI